LTLEWISQQFFTIELFIAIGFPEAQGYILAFFGMVDLLGILPSYWVSWC